MGAQKQLIANQNNAQKATGPRTRKGKSISSRNSLKHGLTAADLVLPGESSAEFKQLRQQVSRHYEPVGPIEKECTDHIAGVAWRLRRVGRFETALLSFEMLQAQVQDAYTAIDLLRNPPEQNFLSEHARPETKGLYQAMSKLGFEAGAQLSDEGPKLGRTAKLAERSLQNVARYEAHLSRQFRQTVHELERLQAARKGNLSQN